MKKLTAEEITKINAINGTLSDRYEYFNALAEILNAESTRVNWSKNYLEAIQLDETTVLNIKCKTVKGKMMIHLLTINDFNKTAEHPYGQCELYQLKKGTLVKNLDCCTH